MSVKVPFRVFFTCRNKPEKEENITNKKKWKLMKQIVLIINNNDNK